jgi:probable rRNA maturation factor
LTKTIDTQNISYFNESGYEVPVQELAAADILQTVLSGEKRGLSGIEIVFTDEAGIIEINRLHLKRDYVTDVISYHYHETPDEPVDGTIYCCAQRIAEQAGEHQSTIMQEFARVLIHGLLHLCGYDDNTPEQKNLMTEKENEYLTRLNYL